MAATEKILVALDLRGGRASLSNMTHTPDDATALPATHSLFTRALWDVLVQVYESGDEAALLRTVEQAFGAALGIKDFEIVDAREAQEAR